MKNQLIISCEYCKFLSQQLKDARKDGNSTSWLYDVDLKQCKMKKTLAFSTVQILGKIEQKPCDDIMIIKDLSGKFKLTNCQNAFGSNTPLVEGMHCAVIGALTKVKGLPEISAIKLIPLGDNDEHKILLYEYWCTEVEDYQLFVAGAMLPQMEFEDAS